MHKDIIWVLLGVALLVVGYVAVQPTPAYHSLTITESIAPAAQAQLSCTPPGPRLKGSECAGGDAPPPHVLGPSFCATSCEECIQQCEGAFGDGTPYLWDSITGACGCEPSTGGVPPPPPPANSCEDVNGDGAFDICSSGGDGTVACNVDDDCLRTEHTTCNTSSQCIVQSGPGINACGDVTAPDDAFCDCAGDCPPGTTECKASTLQSYAPFTGTQACEASKICKGESSENPFALNDSCLCGITKSGCTPTGDYSIGLFQINLLPRCPLGIEPVGDKQCRIINEAELEKCKTFYGFGDPPVNTERAFEISSGGTNWCPWSVAKECGIATGCPE